MSQSSVRAINQSYYHRRRRDLAGGCPSGWAIRRYWVLLAMAKVDTIGNEGASMSQAFRVWLGGCGYNVPCQAADLLVTTVSLTAHWKSLIGQSLLADFIELSSWCYPEKESRRLRCLDQREEPGRTDINNQ